MLSVKKGTMNIRIEKPSLDHFIDAALFSLLFMLFTFDHAEVGLSFLYYGAYFLFVGLTLAKVIMRLRLDGMVNVSGITIWYVLFVLFMVATALWSDYPEVIFEALVRVIQIIILLFCISQTYGTQQGVIRLLRMIAWAATLDVLYIFTNTPYEEWFSGYFGMELTGQNANIIGMILTVSTMVTVYFAYYRKQRIYYLLLFFQLVAVVLTSSRKSVISVCIGLMMIFFLKDMSIKLLARVGVAIVAIVLLFYAIMNVDELYRAIGYRFESMFNYLSETDIDNSMYMRQLFIKYAKQFFWDHPLLGNGPNSFAHQIVEITGEQDYAHNNYYEVLVSYGMVGFLLYYSMYAYIFIKLLKTVITSDNMTAKLMLTVMTVIIICEYGIVLYYSVYPMVFLCAAFLFVCAYDNSLREQQPLPLKGAVQHNKLPVRERKI